LSDDTCWVCKRITRQIILKTAHKVFEEPKLARQIGLEACEIIRQGYLEKPLFFCAKTSRAILSSLFYLLQFRYNLRKPMREFAEVLKLTQVTLRYTCEDWAKNFPKVASARYEREKIEIAKREEEERIILEEIKDVAGTIYVSQRKWPFPSFKVYGIFERLVRKGIVLDGYEFRGYDFRGRRRLGRRCFMKKKVEEERIG